MGNSSVASASSSRSRSRGSTGTEIDTSSPSLPQRAVEDAGVAVGQTLIAILQHPAISALKTKNPGPKATGSSTTDLPLALFLTWLQLARPGKRTYIIPR